jgi:hypothetical protein
MFRIIRPSVPGQPPLDRPLQRYWLASLAFILKMLVSPKARPVLKSEWPSNREPFLMSKRQPMM